jgi:hypothetical protein
MIRKDSKVKVTNAEEGCFVCVGNVVGVVSDEFDKYVGSAYVIKKDDGEEKTFYDDSYIIEEISIKMQAYCPKCKKLLEEHQFGYVNHLNGLCFKCGAIVEKNMRIEGLNVVPDEAFGLMVKLGFEKMRPTVAGALKWLREKFGIFHSIYVRSMDTKKFGFSVGHAIQPIDLRIADLDMYNKYQEKDGVIDDYDQAEFDSVLFALDFLDKRKDEFYK